MELLPGLYLRLENAHTLTQLHSADAQPRRARSSPADAARRRQFLPAAPGCSFRLLAVFAAEAAAPVMYARLLHTLIANYSEASEIFTPPIRC